MTPPARVPVLIVGGGPVGLTLATLLAHYGIASLTLEADDGYCSGSRAICISRRSQEILGWAGADAALTATGLPWSGGRSYYRDREVLHFEMPHDPTQRFAPMVNIQQYFVEEYAHQAMLRQPGHATLQWSARAIAVRPGPDGVDVEAEIDGQLWTLANLRWVQEQGWDSAALRAGLAMHETQGRTVTLLADSSGVRALFAVADPLRPQAREAVARLQALGVQPVVLSGDNTATVRSIAAEAGIQDARGGLLPQDKLDALAELQRTRGPTAMTGDGINDAPALAQADIGFAMGGMHSTGMAMETADVVLMNDDLRRLPEVVELSRSAHAVLWQNIALSLGVKLVFFALALAGNASMWLAVLADMGVSLLVVGNGLRLRRWGSDREAA